MRLWILLCLIIFLSFFAVQRMMYPQINHNSVIDRITHPLDTRLRYRVGDVDPRFHLSNEQVQHLAQQATEIWQTGTSKKLFVYDPNAQLSINLIYDERQAESNARSQEMQILKNTQQHTQNEKNRIQQLNTELENANRELELQKTNYQNKVDQYNQLIYTLNQSQRNLDANARLQLDQQKNQLIIEQSQLKQQIDLFNQKVMDLNSKIDQLNTLNNRYNQSVNQFNTRFQARQFDKGLFNGKSINIYEFESDADLRVTIAHELGHALGLAHNDDPKALMYPIMKEQNVDDFKLTAADLMMLKTQ